MVAAAASATTTFFGLNAPRAAPVARKLPGVNPAIPFIQLGIEAASSSRGRPWNFRTAATNRYTPSASLSTPAHVE